LDELRFLPDFKPDLTADFAGTGFAAPDFTAISLAPPDLPVAELAPVR